MLIGTAFSENLLAIGALITAFIGGLATIYQMIASRREKSVAARLAKSEADDKCYERLLKAHREAEDISTELHELRMRMKRNGT